MKEPVMPRFVGRYLEKRGRLATAALAVSLLFGGCGLLPGRFSDPAPDQALFQQGLDVLAATGSPAAFSRLATEFPDSPWTARAKSIEKIQGRLQEQQRECSQLQKGLEACRVEAERLARDGRFREEMQKELDACRSEKERLASDVQSLEKYTLRLKSLLAEAGIAEPLPPSQ